MKIALLICDYINDDLVPIHGTLSNIFNNFIKQWDFDHVDEFMVYKGEIPPISYIADAYLISGSRHSVNEDSPWINNFNQYLRKKLLQDTPEKFIGFCWGHQILAKSLGGTVGVPTTDQSNRTRWNVGRQRLSINQKKEWMTPHKMSLSLLFNHTEHVIYLPDNVDTIGTNNNCERAMFQYKNKVLGIQAHPEYTNAYQENLMKIVPSLPHAQRNIAIYNNNRLPKEDSITNQWVLNFIQSV